MEPEHRDQPHLPAPTLYPVGFAAGIACVLVGLVVSPTVIAPIGGAIAVVFAFFWVRDAAAEYRGVPEPIEPERREAPAVGTAPAAPAAPKAAKERPAKERDRAPSHTGRNQGCPVSCRMMPPRST